MSNNDTSGSEDEARIESDDKRWVEKVEYLERIIHDKDRLINELTNNNKLLQKHLMVLEQLQVNDEQKKGDPNHDRKKADYSFASDSVDSTENKAQPKSADKEVIVVKKQNTYRKCNQPIYKDSLTCDTCQLPIEGKSVSALGKNYHPDHFVCGVCNKPITESPFHQKDGKPLCNKDFAKLCPKCASCDLPITDKVITALGKEWHENHFICNLCEGVLAGQEFHEKDGKPICQNCFRGKVADKCKGCGEPIETAATVALDAKWHPDCFKCQRCCKPITSTRFKVDGKGFPTCEGC